MLRRAGPYPPRMTQVELTGVPETLLWTLYHRAAEAARPDTVLVDPMAVALVETIDYPFAERFGPARAWQSQWQALRARRFDAEIRRFLATRQGATVVALGEGLETQFWRVDDGRVRWITVDLPETVELRRRLLPSSPRSVAGSALDDGWMHEVDTSAGVLVTAQGLLMYFQPDDARGLIVRCAERFPGGAMLFDVMPRWFTKQTVAGRMKTSTGYSAPPMPYGVAPGEAARIAALSPAIAEVRELRPARGRGVLFGFVIPLAARLGALRARMLTVMLARFKG
jgi:O-methyltransferase involved in polyketide biosynthesis